MTIVPLPYLIPVLYFERLANLMIYRVRPANLVLNIKISQIEGGRG